MRDGPVKPWMVWGLALAVSAAAFVAYVPALSAGFCLYDDPGILLGVNGYRGLSGANFRWMFTTTYMGHYQLLTWLSYAIDYELWGMKAGLRAEGFHLTNVLLHALNAGLVYAVARRLIAAGIGAGALM